MTIRPSCSRPDVSDRPPAETIQATGSRLLGFELREPQLRAVRSILAGRDTLAVLPPGAGKSAIYQVAGALIPGPTVAVSPLIASQRDQIESLTGTELAAAGHNSPATASERREALSDPAEGDLEFLFVAPEQFANPETTAGRRSAEPSLVGVDEADCVSTWGHDFRPDYRRLDGALDELGRPPVLALTATAAPPVRREIVAALGLREPQVLVAGFNRPELYLTVRRFVAEESKRREILPWPRKRRDRASCMRRPGSGSRNWSRQWRPPAFPMSPGTTPVFRSVAGRRSTRRSAAGRAASWRPRPRSAWVSTSLMSASCGTTTSPIHRTPTTRRSGGAGATGIRRRPSCSGARRTWGCAGSSPPARSRPRCSRRWPTRSARPRRRYPWPSWPNGPGSRTRG